MSFLGSEKVICPYCASSIDIVIDHSVKHQEYVEDCEVCCRPILLRIDILGDEVDIQALPENY